MREFKSILFFILAIIVFSILYPSISLAEHSIFLNQSYIFNEQESKTVFVSQNSQKGHIGAASIRRNSRIKRKENLKPQYESCKNENLAHLNLEKIKSKAYETEAEFCFTCSVKEWLGFKDIEKINFWIQNKKTIPQAFREKLMKRVAGQVEAKLFQVQVLKNCVSGNIGWLAKRMKNVDHSLVKASCEKRKQELKDSVKVRWSYMRVNLALSAPEKGKKDTLSSHPESWLDKTPTHTVSSFNKLPPLSKKELAKAQSIYKKTLLKAPLEKLSHAEFKKKLDKGKPLQSSKRVILTNKDQDNLRKALLDLRQKSKENYSRAVSEMSLLAYLKTGDPNKGELSEAFSKIEGKLKDFLKKAKDPETNMGFLLSFKPLVEELLKEDKGYCLTAEKARMQAENDESISNWMMLGVGVLAAVPCLATGPVGASFCLAGGMGLGFVGYKQAQVAKSDSLGRVLTGKEFETIASLEAKEREELLAKLFLPLGAWGTTAVPGRAIVKIGKNIQKQKAIIKKQKAKIIEDYISSVIDETRNLPNIVVKKSDLTQFMSKFEKGPAFYNLDEIKNIKNTGRTENDFSANHEWELSADRFKERLQHMNIINKPLIKRSNGAKLYHGTRSPTLIIFAKDSPIERLLGEAAAWRRHRLNTVKITDLDIVKSYIDDLSKDRAKKKISERLKGKRLSQEVQRLIKENFPVVYGIKPKNSKTAVYYSDSLLLDESRGGPGVDVRLREAVELNEIVSIFVPADKVKSVENMIRSLNLNHTITVSPIEIIR